MSKVERFEDLIAWQKARLLTKDIYLLTQQNTFRSDKGLSSQLQRSAVSIMSNIAERYERSSQPEFRHFLSIAKGSCGELRSQLYISLDIGYITADQFDNLYKLAEEIGRVITGLMTSISQQIKLRGKQ